MNVLDISREEWISILSKKEQPKYRADQIFLALLRGQTFDEMSNLPKELKSELSQEFGSRFLSIERELVSKDGTKKLLYKLYDNNLIESVIMSYEHGVSVCVSTQVGCAMGCAFCASTAGGLIRNLSAGEILSQVIMAGKISGEKVSNVVLMGSGEPLDNFEETLKFLHMISDKDGFNMSLRHVSVSTCGIVPNIRRLTESGLSPVLCISLHAANNEKRREILPIAKAYTIGDIMRETKKYFDKTGRRIIIEYALISGFNDSISDANELRKLLSSLNCHVNLIPLNATSTEKPPSKKTVYTFLDYLTRSGISATVRRTLGADIEGACGQLRARAIEEAEE